MLPSRAPPARGTMGTMTTHHDARGRTEKARRVATIRFVALAMDDALAAPAVPAAPAKAARAGAAARLHHWLRGIIRAIGRLEAARP